MPALTQDDETNLIYACEHGDVDFVAVTLDRHPEALNRRTREDLTLLAHAIHWAQPEVVALLLERGADMEASDVSGGTVRTLAERLNFTSITDLFQSAAEKRERALQWAQTVAAVEQYSSGLEAPLTLPRKTLRLLK